MLPMARVLILFGPVATATWWGFKGINEPVLRLSLYVLVCVLVGLPIFLRYGLPTGVQKELLQRAPRFFNPVLRRVFVSLP
jgi:hypothetical protein